jgi:hypothetical protein
MSNSQGWISLHRKLLKNPIFKNHKLLQTFLYCLLKATHEDYDLLVGDQMVSLQKGQLATGRKAISSATNLSEQNVRTALLRLEKLGILTIKPTSKYSLITVVAWDSYQGPNQQVTNNQPTSNQQVTTNNNINNINNINKEIVIPNGINATAWQEWIKYRKEKKKAVSKAAATKQFKLLLQYNESQQQEIINHSIQNDYQGLFKLKAASNEKNTGHKNKRSSTVSRVRENAARERRQVENNKPMGNNDSLVREPVDEHTRGGGGRDTSMASIIEGSFRDSN